MILYFSATGNSEYVAKRIGKEIGEEPVDLFERFRDQNFSKMKSESPWIVVSPTYAWRIPRILEEWIANTSFFGNQEIYFIMTCGADIGNAGKYLRKLCDSKGLNYRGCAEIVMPENYIVMFTTPTKEEAVEIIKSAEGEIDKAIQAIKDKCVLPEKITTATDKIKSGIVNDAFYPVCIHASKFYVTDACISCGKCVRVCPTKNVTLREGKPVWGKECIHCMACISHCPTEAIEYGKHTKGLPRYTFPE